MLALGVVLFGVSLGDLGAIAAAWNVRHASDVGGAGAQLDVCYLQELGSSALLPMRELEQRGVGTALRGRLEAARRIAMAHLETDQENWRTWTWRGQRRLDAAGVSLRRSSTLDLPAKVDCNGTPLYAPPARLTPPAKP
jgi:hypothetical protein